MTETVRAAMVSIGNVYATHSSLFNYSEGADRAEIFDLTYPQMVARLNAGEPITGDCSSTYEATRRFAGCVNLPPLGFTGTELDTMPHIALAAALPGDAIVFGPAPGKHVVWVTEAHPTDPKVDSHGTSGFDQMTLQEMWQGFRGQPITVLSLAPFLPKPAPALSYHYDWYDAVKVKLPESTNSEQAVVENYDRQRADPAKNAASLRKLELNLAQLVTNVEDVMARENDPKGLQFHRAYRLPRLRTRATGGVVKPTV